MTALFRAGALGIAFSLSALLPAQAPDAAMQSAWDAFRAEAGGHWIARWHPATGTPRELYGEGMALADWRENSLAEARRHADELIRHFGELLGTGASTFTERTGARMGRTWSLTYDQSFAGLPVIGGRVDFRIHMIGRLSFLGSTAVQVPADFDTGPGITEEAATAIAWQSRNVEPSTAQQPGAARQPRLVIWCDHEATAPCPPILAWEVPISAVRQDGSGPIGRAYVDARSGASVGWRNDKHECGIPGCTSNHSPAAPAAPAAPVALPPATYTVMGWLHTGFSPVSTPTNEPLVGVEVNVPGVGTVVTDQNGQFTLNLSAPVTVTVDLNGIHNQLITGVNALTATLTLQPGVSQTFQLGAATSTDNELAHTTTYYWTYQVNELLRSIVGNVPEMSQADLVSPRVNLTATCNAYYTNNTINFYNAGSGCNNTAYASVVAHEWGHGIDDRFGGISQTNGLSEGWGDICSIYLLDDPTIGHDFYTTGAFIRTGTNTRQYPTGSGPHAQGESWMGFAWKYRENLRAQFGTQQAIAISNDTVLGTLVADATDQQGAVLQVFIADDNDGNLTNGTPHYNQLEPACLAHSLPYPVVQAGTITHAPLGNSTRQLTPRVVECDAVANFGSITQVRVLYNDGQPRQRDMIPTGTTDRYRAMLPGMPSQTTLTYHFEAVHNSTFVIRYPATGEISYETNEPAVVYREDFETGAPGWTHGVISGTDDWEIGIPAGHSTALWSDPPTAASGLRCAGTDLTGDGAYSPSTVSWLRSPTLNFAGQNNLYIRFNRWVSCPATFNDSLQLWVNGWQIWSTPYAVFVENQWVQFSTQLWVANNNPSTQLEFRLVSDASEEYGGWNIDDIEIYTTSTTQPPTTALQILPEQVQQTAPLSLSIQTPTQQPFLLVIGTQPGPTNVPVPGVPPLQVGGSTLSLFNFTNASGSYTHAFNAPGGVPLQGLFWYSQVLTLDANSKFVVSNPHINLFTQ